MIKILIKYFFWSALAFFFCFISGKNISAKAADDHIVINEIYSAPLSGEKEWAELYNSTISDINLADYSLKDGGVAAKNLSGTILSGGYFVFEASSGWLNNSGETLSLIYKPTNITIDQVTYGDWDDNQDNQPPAPSGGKSLSRIPNGFDSDNDLNDFRVLALSKDGENILPTEVITPDIDPEIPLIDILSARQTEAGETVRVSGVVTIIPGKLSDQYLYIQDETGGIQIYCYKKDFPKLQSGDFIQVTGEISDYYSDKRLKIRQASDIKIIGQKNLPAVISTTIDEINDSMIGKVVEIEGTVSETSGSVFYIEGSGEIKINIKEKTGIKKPRMSRGDRVRIVGVVSKYKNSYQILPFEQSGVTILTSGLLPKGGKSAKSKFNNVLICLVVWNILPTVKWKAKKLLKSLL